MNKPGLMSMAAQNGLRCVLAAKARGNTLDDLVSAISAMWVILTPTEPEGGHEQ